MSGIDLVYKVGPQVNSDGAPVMGRADKEGAIVTNPSHGEYFEAARRGRIFYAANSAAQAVSVALATTYTGLVLSNPAGSGVDLSLLHVGVGLTLAPAAIASLGLIGGWTAAGVTAHTTALVPGGTYLGGAAGVGKADSAATIPTPVWLDILASGFTAAALPSTSPVVLDKRGVWVVPPGGFLAIGALTAVTGFFSMLWEEVPR